MAHLLKRRHKYKTAGGRLNSPMRQFRESRQFAAIKQLQRLFQVMAKE